MGDNDILEKILTTKAEEVIAAQVERPFAVIDRDARAAAPPRGFVNAIRARVASLLTAVGLPELICDDVKSYVAKIIALARDAGERRRLREHLEGPGRESALFDTKATTRALESAYVAMAEQYRRQVRQPIRVGAEGLDSG